MGGAGGGEKKARLGEPGHPEREHVLLHAVAIIPAPTWLDALPREGAGGSHRQALVQHVWERARLAAALSRVVVATDDRSVYDAVRAFGGESVMTRVDHPNGTSRLAEAAALLDLEPDRIIVNVQGGRAGAGAGDHRRGGGRAAAHGRADGHRGRPVRARR